MLSERRMMHTQNDSSHINTSIFSIAAVGTVGLVAPLLFVELILWLLLRIEWMYYDNTMEGRWFYYLPMIVPSSLASILSKWLKNAPSDLLHCAIAMAVVAVSSVVLWWASFVMAMNTNFDPRPLLPFWVGLIGFLQLGMNFEAICVFSRPKTIT